MQLQNVITTHVAYLQRGNVQNFVNVPNAVNDDPSVRILGNSRKQFNMASSKRKRKMARQKMRMNEHHRMEYDKIIVHPRNPRQKLYMDLIDNKKITIAAGFPGTSKTLIALYKAFQMLDNKEIDKIYIARPKVGVKGEKDLGALPGTLEEKTEPYLIAIRDCLEVFMTPGRIDHIMKSRGKEDSVLEFLPLDFLRGRTLRRAFVLIDEAQNVSVHTMFTILTRIGEGSKYVITGDVVQRDLNPKHGKSGIEDAMLRLSALDFVGIVQFLYEDICRSDEAKAIIECYKDLYGYGK